MRTGTELEHEQLVKGVNKNANWKKEILLVKRLIGTEKRKQNTFKRVYDWQLENRKNFGTYGTQLQYVNFLSM